MVLFHLSTLLPMLFLPSSTYLSFHPFCLSPFTSSLSYVLSFSPFNYTLSHLFQVKKRKKGKMSPAASTRWCPTPEQLMILEEMYRGGVKTPNATQIQQITAHLSLYGKIEGKNVFYWFQNHKARDRQKLRRKLCRQQQQQMQMQLQQQMQLHLHPAYHPHQYLFDQSSSASLLGLHPFLHLDSLNWLPQEGLIQETPSQVMMNYSSKMHTPTSYNEEMDNWTKMYGQDCMRMMMDMAGPTSPCCSSNRPLKTLQLFPVNSSSSLKDECTTSFNSAVSDHQLN